LAQGQLLVRYGTTSMQDASDLDQLAVVVSTRATTAGS
jgi:hypothetical protein